MSIKRDMQDTGQRLCSPSRGVKILLAAMAASAALGEVAQAEEQSSGHEPRTIVGNVLIYESDQDRAIGYRITGDENGQIIAGMSSGGAEIMRLNSAGTFAIGMISIDAPPDTNIGDRGFMIGNGGQTVLGGRMIYSGDNEENRHVVSGGFDLDQGSPHLAYRFEMLHNNDETVIRRAFGIYADGASEDITGRFLQEWQQRIGENGQLEYGGSITATTGTQAEASVAGNVFYTQRMGANDEWTMGAGFSAVANTLGDVDLTLSAEVLRRFDQVFRGISLDMGVRIEGYDGGKNTFTLQARVPFG